MKKTYTKEFDFGKQMRDFAWRLYNKNHNVKILSQEFNKSTNKYTIVWCYE